MSEKSNFLKENKELAQKILLLYQVVLDFEKRKNKFSVEINSQKKNEKTKKTIYENKRSI
jgi:hypothetical protein